MGDRRRCPWEPQAWIRQFGFEARVHGPVYPDSAEIRKNPLPTAVGAILLHP
jgi:hypothetical protein